MQFFGLPSDHTHFILRGIRATKAKVPISPEGGEGVTSWVGYSFGILGQGYSKRRLLGFFGKSIKCKHLCLPFDTERRCWLGREKGLGEMGFPLKGWGNQFWAGVEETLLRAEERKDSF